MDFSWIVLKGDVSDDAAEVAFWEEQDEIDRWVAAGAPPLEEWRAGEAPKPKAKVKLGAAEVVVRVYTKEQAAKVLQMSVDSLERHVMGKVKTISGLGRLVRIPVNEIDRYIEREARRAL